MYVDTQILTCTKMFGQTKASVLEVESIPVNVGNLPLMGLMNSVR